MYVNEVFAKQHFPERKMRQNSILLHFHKAMPFATLFERKIADEHDVQTYMEVLCRMESKISDAEMYQ